MIDQLLETDGRALFNVWFFNRDGESLGEYLQLEHVVPGLADAGAHAGQICDADAPTHYLAYWGHERHRMSLEKAVNDLTANRRQRVVISTGGRDISEVLAMTVLEAETIFGDGEARTPAAYAILQRLAAVGRANGPDLSASTGPQSPNRRVEFEIGFDNFSVPAANLLGEGAMSVSKDDDVRPLALEANL